MKPISLTLKGFRGIRDGLGRDSLTLHFDRIAGDAQLIAIVGKNGCGKTTVMDNLTPYPVMPSRAGADGLGGFSYYDQVHLPESSKELVWEHGGRSYRSQQVFRINGKRKTESFLHVESHGGWKPVALEDGTVSDGKTDTYLRCVESVLGSAETFFTSVFSAQGRRQLSSYKNAEIKTLLADLLGLDGIRAMGAKASETVKLVKVGLNALRQKRAELAGDAQQVARELAGWGDTVARVAEANARRAACELELNAAKDALAAAKATRAQAQVTEARRSQLLAERDALAESHASALSALVAQQQRDEKRLSILDKRIAQRAEDQAKKRRNHAEQRQRLLSVTCRARQIHLAARRLPQAERVAKEREARLGQLRADQERLGKLRQEARHIGESMRSIEREAGQAVLKAQELARRFGLTAEVPCAGTDLQGGCKLLQNAREAKALKPSADALVKRLEAQEQQLRDRLDGVLVEIAKLRQVPKVLEFYERKAQRAKARAYALALTAARREELDRAVDALATVEAQIQESAKVDHGETTLEKTERATILKNQQDAAAQHSAQEARYRASLGRIDKVIVALPAPFDEASVMRAQRAVERATYLMNASAEDVMAATRNHQQAELAKRQQGEREEGLLRLDRQIARIEEQVGTWTLFARCMSNDGLIALSIDDAGPALSGLANDLLLASYGPRFTVSIRTQVETSKGEAREGFDIVVHDGETDSSKSVTLMSGGERTWINECLIRAIALYLAQNAGRHYETLFSDEADGPLDPERKRMFMAMKREVLRIGGYRQEYFVSQTPELTAMADAVIDLEAMRLNAEFASGYVEPL